MSRWWEQDMADASQGMFADPNLALSIATMPNAALMQQQGMTPEQQQQQDQDARKSKSGFLSSVMDTVKSTGGVLDGALSTLVGDSAANKVEDVAKYAGKGLWYPVDKTASGAYWLYSNGVSQPLSTLFLMTGTAQGSGVSGGAATNYFSAGDWAKMWHKANDLSPAQVVMNIENTDNASGNTTAFGSLFGADANKLSQAEKDQVKRQQDRFISDTDYWRNKQGWSYTVGTGSLDFMTSLGIDPSYSALKIGSAAVKGARTIRVAGEATQATKGLSLTNRLTDAAANKITQQLAKTPEEAMASKKVINFFNWIDEPSTTGAASKSAFEIRRHPIWGRGRRVNPAKYQLSEILANSDQAERPMIMRFAMGDNSAVAELSQKNAGLLSQIGKMQDNRKLVDSVKYNPALYDHYTAEAQGLPAPDPNLLTRPPFPRPTTPGARQQGWDAAYGNLDKQSRVFNVAAQDILASGLKPLGKSKVVSKQNANVFQQWKDGELTSLDAQISTLQKRNNAIGRLFNAAPDDVEAFSPGRSNIFGTTKSLYRQGAIAGDTSKAADKNILKVTVDRRDRQVDGGLVHRIISSGYYNVPLRIVQSFGDRLPQTVIDHNAEDATERVNDMLKRVPGLGQEVRLGMLNAYSAAPDKVAKSDALSRIHTDVVKVMAKDKGLSHDAAVAVDQMIKDGSIDAYNKLVGKAPQQSQRFSASINPLTEHRADMYQDGEAWRIMPTAKTQLSYAEPLLDVKELGRFLDRSSGYLQRQKQAGANMYDAVMSIADSASNIWKAATLLRPGYTLRAPSEEMAASAIKGGLMASIMTSAHGGKNWALNRAQQIRAVAGKGSYASTITGETRLRILDPETKMMTKSLDLPVTNLRVSSAWPVVMDRINTEKELLKATQREYDMLDKAEYKRQSKIDYKNQRMSELIDDMEEHQTIIDEHTDYMHELLRLAEDAKGRRAGEGLIEHNGQVIPQAFSGEWDHPIARDQLSSEHAMQTMFARGEGIDTARMIKTGGWTTVAPEDPHYMSSLLDALNKHWAQDDLYRRVAGDMSLDAAKKWLTTQEGKFHLSHLGGHAQDPERLLAGIRQTLQDYTAGNPTILDKIANGVDVTKADVTAAIAKEDLMPVHGEEVKSLTAQGHSQSAAGVIDNTINKMFRRLGTIPTDIMSRHPTYLRAQEARIRTLIDEEVSYRKSVGADTALDNKTMNDLLKKSDQLARKDISQVVYDPTRTTATQALRFIAPFMSAHIDGLERWGGLIAEKPQLVSTASKIYNAPVAAHLVTDSQGNPVDENGYATLHDPVTGKVTGRKFVGIQDRTIHMKLPFGAKIPGIGGEVPIKVQAMNTITPGDPWWNPGTGPLVQIAASKLAQKNPGMGDFLQWAKVLPYGPTGLLDSVTPAYVKNVWNSYQAASGNTSSEAFQKTMLAEYQRQVALYHDGKGPAPDMRRAEKQAKQFTYLKALTSWASPAQTQSTPLTGTPYQFYVDQYKQMQNADPKNADTNFLAKYGEDYFVFTASLSKSIGIAPTIPALTTAKEYKDLIAGDPDLAPFVIGDVYNQGKFSQSAYQAEKGMQIGGQAIRSTMSVQDAIADNDRRLGWAEYTKVMNTVDASLLRAGFHSYTQKGAEQFQQLKQSITGSLKQLHPAWEEDFDQTDTGLLPRRIESFKILVQDPRLRNDPMRTDVTTMAQYLAYRDVFKQALAARGVSQLSVDPEGNPYGPNADLAYEWHTVQTGLLASNTKFADTFNRYLSHDNLQ